MLFIAMSILWPNLVMLILVVAPYHLLRPCQMEKGSDRKEKSYLLEVSCNLQHQHYIQRSYRSHQAFQWKWYFDWNWSRFSLRIFLLIWSISFERIVDQNNTYQLISIYTSNFSITRASFNSIIVTGVGSKSIITLCISIFEKLLSRNALFPFIFIWTINSQIFTYTIVPSSFLMVIWVEVATW